MRRTALLALLATLCAGFAVLPALFSHEAAQVCPLVAGACVPFLLVALALGRRASWPLLSSLALCALVLVLAGAALIKGLGREAVGSAATMLFGLSLIPLIATSIVYACFFRELGLDDARRDALRRLAGRPPR